VTIDVERRASRLTATERDEMTPSLRRTCAAIVRLIEQTGSLVFVTVSTEALSDRRRLGLKSAADRRFGRRGASAALTITAHLRHRDAESIVVLTSSTTAPMLSASPAELPSPRRVDSAPPVSSPNDQLPPVVRAGVPTHINEARRFHPAGTRLIGLA
jgi:hypothetical protein